MPIETNKNEKNVNNEKEKSKENFSFSSLIHKLKQTAEELNVAYNPHAEQDYGKKLLEEHSFQQFCKGQNISPIDMAVWIMRTSVSIKYWK